MVCLARLHFFLSLTLSTVPWAYTLGADVLALIACLMFPRKVLVFLVFTLFDLS